ncbi:sugar phosphate isomerase/epimerase family protein [Tautonia plasticadhaerens]|uniref:L-ribulose-5-phosphate 3-epimerase UlaE n=1 Tax=Tautonia plasticadhaerens TaxID=2527974 RepID=A0A518GX93_9BACT|nr:sugar phosphate isomerase/epimerase family protein [Tautonia plasticadhaerens]QDV33216.1 L-ribulose-5-phosphate 3-epimerase UlaE [Tautonia plasticadhaerens]
MTNRRSFLRSSGLGLAASLASGIRPSASLAAQETTAGPPIRKAIKIGMAPRDLPLVERFKLIKVCGFDGVDMDSPNDLPREEVIRARDESGLIIHGCVCSTHWSSPLSHPDPEVRAKTVSGMTTALEDCKAYGGTTVLLVPAVVNESISYADAYDRSQAEVRSLLPKAEELGITVAFENVWNNFLLSPLEFARYIDEFESDRVGAYFDIGNVVRFGWPEQWVRILGDRIVKLDVKEYSRDIQMNEGLAKGFNVPLGEGSVDWPAVVQAIDEIGYRGWATAELRGGDADYLEDVATRMDRCFGMG